MFEIIWTESAANTFKKLEENAFNFKNKKSKSSREKGLFKQVYKAIELLSKNPRHPGLQTHEYSSLQHPYDSKQKVFEAYVQNKTPGAYRLFWCYGPDKKQITIIAITPHP